MSEECTVHGSLKTEIDNIKEDIREIKTDAKETNIYFREVISSLTENSIRQTEILKNQERQFTETNNDITGLRGDITELRTDMHSKLENETKWYQNFLSDTSGKVLKILFIIILILLGAKASGIDLGNLLNNF